ncbi:MAG TPA: DNA internalization-related competence protein ComEC/Rec2 [Candidatus Acidoferrales bacterium]|nr:DNA internalization-related competence protein ComEC/Rec2 [Candidatus Acidoferrales bacterium]
MPPFTLVACAAAAATGTLALLPETPSDLRPLVAIGLAAFAGFALRPGAREVPQFRALLLVTLVAASARAAFASHRTAPPFDDRTARYGGIVLDRTPAADGSGATILLALDDGVRAQMHVYRGSVPPIGARALVRGRLQPFDGPRNPDEPSEAAIQRERGVDARLDGASILTIREPPAADVRTLLPLAHQWAHEQLQRRLGEPAASVVAGELWGERSALPPQLRAEFQETGTVHVLVTAGLHLGVVAALVVGLLSALALPRAATCAIAAAGVWLFVAWSGAQLPAVRAATMVSAALSARALGRATFSWNALALAALALVFARPESVASASFALSFSCVAAIFACAQTLERGLERIANFPSKIREALVLSLATQLGTWPLGAAVFLQFAPYGAIANLAVVPCVAATMTLGAAQLATAWLPPVSQALANLNSYPLAWILGSVSAIASLPGASIPMTPPPAWCIALYDAALLAVPWMLRRTGGAAVALAGLAVTAALVLWPPRPLDGGLRVSVLDVGQADAIVVQTPRGHALLVDGGGRLERGGPSDGDSSAERVGERTVVPFLVRHGIHALDAIVISHPHGDHAGGIAPALRRLRVTTVADGGQRYGGHAYRDALETARAEGVPIVYPRAGTQWRTDDGVALRFLGPSLPLIANSRNDINENSIAFTLRYKSFCMLFTGDAGAAAERRFLSERVDLRCEVLKVGHHGSAYSSTPAFIAAVRPRYAIVSVGRHNLFGHPAPSTLETLARFGATIYRTDENGAVTVTTDGAAFAVHPAIGGPRA